MTNIVCSVALMNFVKVMYGVGQNENEKKNDVSKLLNWSRNLLFN